MARKVNKAFNDRILPSLSLKRDYQTKTFHAKAKTLLPFENVSRKGETLIGSAIVVANAENAFTEGMRV